MDPGTNCKKEVKIITKFPMSSIQLAQINVEDIVVNQDKELAADNSFAFVLCQSAREVPALLCRLLKINCSNFLRIKMFIIFVLRKNTSDSTIYFLDGYTWANLFLRLYFSLGIV